MMSADLDWTSALGEAVVADQGAVLEAVQASAARRRRPATSSPTTSRSVKVEKEIIKIVPADPQVIYVPQYNPTTVVVYSAAPVYGATTRRRTRRTTTRIRPAPRSPRA